MLPILLLLQVALTPLVVAAQPPQVGPREYLVDREASQLYVVVHRAGLLSFLGHEHAIVPTAWSATLCLADPVPENAWASLTIDASQLDIDSDTARALAGLGGGPGDEDRARIRTTMLDSTHLAAAEYPEIRLELQPRGPQAGSQLSVRGALHLRGVTREVEVPITMERPGTVGWPFAAPSGYVSATSASSPSPARASSGSRTRSTCTSCLSLAPLGAAVRLAAIPARTCPS